MFLKKTAALEVTPAPDHFPPDFIPYWLEVRNPRAIRQEMAALLLAEFRLAGPNWPTERYALLKSLLPEE